MIITASRYHDISCGHRVVGHENKCRNLHGHNYRIHFHAIGDLDKVGRVIDFGVLKSTLCEWLEEKWDHRFLAWENDPLMRVVAGSLFMQGDSASVVWVPFNPTAENMAHYLLNDVGPTLLHHTGVILERVTVEETRKCSASVRCTEGVIKGPQAELLAQEWSK